MCCWGVGVTGFTCERSDPESPGEFYKREHGHEIVGRPTVGLRTAQKLWGYSGVGRSSDMFSGYSGPIMIYVLYTPKSPRKPETERFRQARRRYYAGKVEARQAN